MKRYLVILLMTMAVLFSASAGEREVEVARLKQKYNAARSATDRMNVCIEAINKGFICRGCKLNDMDEIFSTDFHKLDEASLGYDQLYTGVVHFEPASDNVSDAPLNGVEPTVAAGYKGWYLAFKFDRRGKITTYHLSNLHK